MRKISIKKTLSVFLAVLMVALVVPMSVLAVAAEEEPVAATIVGVESTNGAKTTGGVTYLLDWAIDGDMTTTYIAANESSLKYGVTDGVFGDGDTYRDYITVELSALSTLNSVTIWANEDKASKAFANHAFDVYYSADGENWTLHSEYRNVCGNDTSAGEGSAAFTEERLVGELTHYGLKLDMNGAAVKYVRIAVVTGRIDRGWANLREIEVDGVEGVVAVDPETPETPTPEDPTPEDPTPEDPTPEDPAPEDPTPEDPAPEDPAPEDPTPEDPAPETPVDPETPGEQPGGEEGGETGEQPGDENTGNENTGNENTGNENTGNENTGNENTGDENTGNNGSNSADDVFDESNANNNTDTKDETPTTDAPKPEEKNEVNKWGCGSTLSMTGVALVGACAAMLAIKRRKNEEN